MASAPTINQTMGPLEWGLLILLSVLWGGSFFFAEIALVELRPFTVVFGRVVLAAATLVILVKVTGGRMPRDRRLWAAFFVMGTVNNFIPFSLIVWGQTQITSGLASILNATTPVFTVLMAHFFTRDEKLTANRFAGVVLGIAGVVVMIGPEALAGLGANVLAQLAVVGAAVSYGVAGVFGRRFAGTPPLVTAAGQVTASSVLMFPVMLIVDRPWTLAMPAPETWAAVLGIALVSTAAAYVIFFRILATAGATNIMLVTLLVPVSAILLGVLVLGETLAPLHMAGMALIGLGLLAIDGRVLSMMRRRLTKQAADARASD